jgi:hypothetical protein
MYPATYPPTSDPPKMQSLFTGQGWRESPKNAIFYAARMRREGQTRRPVLSPSSPRPLNPSPCHCRVRRPLRLAASLLAGVTGMTMPSAWSADGDIATIYSEVSPDYTRVRLTNGSFQPETYTFGEGGRMAGLTRDETADALTFLDVAKVVATPLAKRNYVPVEDRNPEKTDQLIMVYWGTTAGTSDASDSLQYQNLQRSQGLKQASAPPPSASGPMAAGPGANAEARQNAAVQNARQAEMDGDMAAVLAENWQRDQEDMRNALLLGYDKTLAETSSVGATPLSLRHDDLISELEESRYFVVLMAYDYQALWKQKKHRLLWVTRFSVRARGADFEKLLPSMVGYASQYFGQDSHGLIRRSLPEGHVHVGEPKSLGTVP